MKSITSLLLVTASFARGRAISVIGVLYEILSSSSELGFVPG